MRYNLLASTVSIYLSIAGYCQYQLCRILVLSKIRRAEKKFVHAIEPYFIITFLFEIVLYGIQNLEYDFRKCSLTHAKIIAIFFSAFQSLINYIKYVLNFKKFQLIQEYLLTYLFKISMKQNRKRYIFINNTQEEESYNRQTIFFN